MTQQKQRVVFTAVLVFGDSVGLCLLKGAEYRFWTTADGKQTRVKLAVVSQSNVKVKLKREDDGKVFEIPIQRLSHPDQQYVRNLVAPSNSREGTSNSDNWPRFHGTNGSGISPSTGVPTEWSSTSNMVWKRDMPGMGTSSPIVWGGHVYVTCFTGHGTEDEPRSLAECRACLQCINRDDGALLWEDSFPLGFDVRAPINFSQLVNNDFANNTPVADETGVYVYWPQTGIVAYDHDGKNRRVLRIENQPFIGNGGCSSPIIYQELVIINTTRVLVALDKKTGKEAWRHDCCEHSTPAIMTANNTDELIFHLKAGGNLSGEGTMSAVNPLTGQQLWSAKAVDSYKNPSPTVHDGVAYALGLWSTVAIRAGGRGDVSDSHVLWRHERKGSEVCSPVYHDGHLYYSNEGGIAHCHDVKNGELIYENRMRPSSGTIYASGVLADDKIYYVSREKGTFVVAAKPQFEQLAHNVIEDDDSIFNATPAVSGGRLFIRSRKTLYCIGER